MKRLLLIFWIATLALGCTTERDAPAASTENSNASEVAISSPDATTAVAAAERPSDDVVAEPSPPRTLRSPESSLGEAQRSVLLPIEKPTASDPVNAGAVILPTAVEPGDVVEFQVAIAIADGWHIYGTQAGAGPNPPTRLTLDLPEGYVDEGEGQSTEADLMPTPQGASYQHREYARLVRKIRIPQSAKPGAQQIEATLDFQPCNATRCLQPESLPLKATLQVLPRSERPSAP